MHLRDYCFDHLNQKIRPSDLWLWLETKGYKRQIYPGSPRLGESLAAQTETYLEGVRGQLIKPQFPRQISAAIISQLVGAKEGLDIVVLGSPGGGKSAVMLEVTDSCVKRGWPVLAFRLDEISAQITAQQLQAALNLPLPPAQAISYAAAGQPALVVIDQLDAVSHYSGRTSVLFDRIAKLVQEIRGHRLRSPIHVLIACRDIDWKQDGRFRQLHRPRFGPEMADEAIHQIEKLTDEEIGSILKNCGLNAATFSPRQYDELLRRPQYLALFIEANISSEEIPTIITPKQLFDAYWRSKERKMAQAFPGVSQNHWTGILKLITNRLSQTALKLNPPKGKRNRSNDDAPLAVAVGILDDFPRTSIEWMISNGVLVESGRRIRFGHESLFDYCFARFFEERGQSLLEYLSEESDQTLIQRGQLRQVMAYLRDDDPDCYVETAKELLDSEKIRPHLKLLLTVVLCSVPDPSDSEWNLICSYVGSALKDIDAGNTTTLACHIFYAFSGSSVLFKSSVSEGAFQKWIAESGPLAVDRLFRVLLRHQEAAQQEVWQVIAPLLGEERFKGNFEWFTQFCKASRSRETFEWLITVMKDGFKTDEKNVNRRDRFYSLCDDLEKHKPSWLAEWIAALINVRSDASKDGMGELIRDHAVEPKDIISIAEKCPREFVDHVLPAVISACERHSEPSWIPWSGRRYNEDTPHFISTEHVMFDSLTSSLVYMLNKDLSFARRWLDRLSESTSTMCRTIYAAVLCHDELACVKLAADFLTLDDEAFSISYLGNLAACKIIGVHISRFSEVELALVEEAILKYYPSWENGYGYIRRAKRGERPFCRGTNRGYSQMRLLRSFPEGYLGSLAAARLNELKRKFKFYWEPTPKPRKESENNESIFKSWKPQRYLEAALARDARGTEGRSTFQRDSEQITVMLRKAVKDQPSIFVEQLESQSSPLLASYLKTVAGELVTSELGSELALRAAIALRRNGIGMSQEHLYLLGKVSINDLPDSEFNDFLNYLTEGSPPDLDNFGHSGKRSDRLHSAAINSIRGQGIRVLVDWIWEEPAIVSKISSEASNWMRDPNPAIRSEMASLCYAIACRDQNRELAQELFAILIGDSLPEEEVLASHWPFKFLHSDLRENWDFVGPVIHKMARSSISEVHAAGARLACIGLLTGCDCYELANSCVKSDDASVRLACADVASHNLNNPIAGEWMKVTFMALADDPDKDVCRAVGQSFYRRRHLDFSQMGAFLTKYLKTRSFLLGSGALISSIEESATVLPKDLFEIVRTLIQRLNEPVDDSDDRLHYHIESVSSVLKRLYHENRDGEMRREALDLIDQLCLQGSLAADSLDQ